jgi:phosphomethylpyrimidine synthase
LTVYSEEPYSADFFASNLGPLPCSQKSYKIIEHHWSYAGSDCFFEMKVPSRKVLLSDGKNVSLYDTSGSYSHSDFLINFDQGLPEARFDYLYGHIDKSDNPAKPKTQLYYARKGIITPEMVYVAQRESHAINDMPEFKAWMVNRFQGNGFGAIIPDDITAEYIRDEIAQGRAIIPANHKHRQLEPMIIGRGFSVKVNANLGLNTKTDKATNMIHQMMWATRWGADTVMSLSTGLSFDDLSKLVRNSHVPVGSVPIYDALAKVSGDLSKLSWEIYKEVLISHAEAGVDYITVHAGILQKHLPAVDNRISKIVSRGGRIMADWMRVNNKENFIDTNFDQLCEVLAKYDMVLSLGDGLRPGCIADANDAAQCSEMEYLGELTEKAWRFDIQTMIEGPGHMPMHMIQEHMKKQMACCQEAPFYTMGPLVTGIAPGYDHLSSAIGAAMIGWYGCSMLCYAPEHSQFGFVSGDNSKNSYWEGAKRGMMAYKIAAHAADLSKGNPRAWMRDYLISEAQFKLNWDDQFNLSLDPQVAKLFNQNDFSSDPFKTKSVDVPEVESLHAE